MKLLFFLLISSLLFGQFKYVKTMHRADINDVEYTGKLKFDKYEPNLKLTYFFDEKLVSGSIFTAVDLNKAYKLEVEYYKNDKKHTKTFLGKMPKVKRKKSKKDK